MDHTSLRSLALGTTLLAAMACGSDSPTGPRSPADAPRQLIAAGVGHTCRISGTATHCWGAGLFGMLGNDADTLATTPVLVLGERSFVSIAAGVQSTCALTTAGQVYCWGGNMVGQLGNGDPTGADRSTPVKVAGGHTFVALTSSHGHICALTREGEAYCWGWNEDGQLGDGTTSNALEPVAVNTALRFTRIAAHSYHTCALTREGAAYCWGANTYGQLGDSTTSSRRTPRAVVGGHTFVALGGGMAHSCALTAAGKTYCWGRNQGGQLGIGTADTVAHPVPAPVAGAVTLRSFSQGGAGGHLCGRSTTDAAHCWGTNHVGQLGNGKTDDLALMAPTAPTLTWKQLAAGLSHTCGLTTDGATYCWGHNEYGQIGDGSTTDRHTPIRVSATASSARVVGGGQPTLARESASPAALFGPLSLGRASTR